MRADDRVRGWRAQGVPAFLGVGNTRGQSSHLVAPLEAPSSNSVG